MLYGDYVVDYTPVEAYPVMTMDFGIISGGTGDHDVVVQTTRFFWVYDPNNLEVSGFTGEGWFTDQLNTPLYGINEAKLLEEFQNGREDLTDYFETWKDKVSSQPPGADYVKDFIFLIGSNCFSFNPS